MFTNFRYPSPRPPAVLSPPTFKSESTQNAISLPKFPAVKMLKRPLLKSVLGMNGATVPEEQCVKIAAIAPGLLEERIHPEPIGGRPGNVPGQMALGKSSFWAGAPSRTGGISRKPSSSVGNLKAGVFECLPKVIQFRKIRMAGCA